MPNTIRHKRNSTAGVRPSTTDLTLGELGINTRDGRVFTKKNDGSDAIVEVTPNGVLSTSLDNDYPTTRPTLDLNFAQTKRLDPRVTFSRSSSGTYFDANGVLQSAATNVARFDHNPSTEESLGLLVEEARTNSATYGIRLDDASWTKSALTVLPNATLSPDGTYMAVKLVEAASGSAKIIYKAVSGLTNGAAYTLSLYAKAGERDALVISDAQGSVGVTFKLSTQQSSVFQGSPSSYSITPCGDGWYRCSVSFAASATTVQPRIYISKNFPYGNYTGDGTSGIYLWGIQLEAGSFPTSYIPTPATFTSRSSTATYYDANGVIQTASTNVARSAAFFPDSNGVMRPAGLLLEAEGTNLVTYSEQFDNAAWSKTVGANTVTISANAATAPDGTSSADKIITSTSNAIHGVALSSFATVTSGTVYTVSVYAKAAGWGRIGIRAGASATSLRCTVNLSTGDIINNSAGTATVAYLPNGWYRISIAGVIASTSSEFIIEAHNTTTVQSNETGDGTSGIFIWGAQLEASPYPTSYIPTTTATVTRSADVSSSATVTRSADVAEITGTNFSSWYNQNNSTIYAKSSYYGATIAGQYGTVWSLSANVSSNNFMGRFHNGAGFNAWHENDAVALTYVGTGATGPFYQTAASYSQEGQTVNKSLAMNGYVAADAPGTTAYLVHDRLKLGRPWDNAYFLNGVISRLTYWPTRLSDATLQAITR